jgi:DNA-binding LytR/AlgR family response regulator
MDVGRIVVLGFISVSVLITINQNRLLRAHLKTAQQLNKKLEGGKHKKEKLVHFLSEYKKDELTLKSDSIVLIKSSDNYIEVYYLSDGKIVKQMIRSTLKKAEELLSEFDFIIRCHRTFIININHIKEIQGNSQGYKLYFNQIDFPAIVSQKYINEFNILVKKA